LDIYQVILFLEDYQKNNNNNKDNLIRGEIFIDKDHINKDIRIINSFENTKREKKWRDRDNDWKYKNEKEIKENIEIKINEKTIEFTYTYKFKKRGKYKIEYLFKNNLTKTRCMFHGCISLTNLNLSNFNIQNVTSMFSGCNSLTKKNIITKDN
jgi:surface protein